MQKLSEMKKQSILNDVEIVIEGNELVLALIREIEEEYRRTGKVNRKKLKVLQPFHATAKAHLLEELSELKEAEEKADDPVKKYWHIITLKDPQARERVRNALRSIMTLACERADAAAQGGEHGDMH